MNDMTRELAGLMLDEAQTEICNDGRCVELQFSFDDWETTHHAYGYSTAEAYANAVNLIMEKGENNL